MEVECRAEKVAFPAPVMTPVGAMDSVWSVEVTVGDDRHRGVGRVRCVTETIARQVLADTFDLVSVIRTADQSVDAEVWTWWSTAWADVAAGASLARLRALSGLDAAMWDLAPPARARGARLDPRIYWSGFWLGTSPDDARREAAWAVREGYDAVKMRADATDIGASAERFRAIADQLPQRMGIAIELAGTGTVASVTGLVEEVDARRVLWVEDPVPAAMTGDTAFLSANLTVPVAGGETCAGVEVLDEYAATTGLAMPILDLACCGGPSALAAFLRGPAQRFDSLGVHLDATLTATAIPSLEGHQRIYVEVMDWWEHTTPAALRAVLANAVD